MNRPTTSLDAVHSLVAPGREAPASPNAFKPHEVLAKLPHWGWTMRAHGERHAPDLLVAHYVMSDYVDVFVTRGPDRCGAYRARIWPDQDPIDVYAVTWCVVGDMATVLWSVLNLRSVERGWPDYDLPPELRALLPGTSQYHYTNRPPQ